MLSWILGQNLFGLLNSETEYLVLTEWKWVFKHISAQEDLKKKKSFVSNKLLCLPWAVKSPWKILEENVTAIIEISIA